MKSQTPKNPKRFADSLSRFGKFLEAQAKHPIPEYLLVEEARILLDSYYGGRFRTLCGLVVDAITFYWSYYVSSTRFIRDSQG